MTKAAKKQAKGKAIAKRVARQAVSKDLGPAVAKAAIAPEAQGETVQAQATTKPYSIFVDSQAVAYLRVEESPKASKFIINTGSKTVDLIEMDKATMKSRGLQAVPEASVLDAAKVLAKPLSSGIIVSERAKKYLTEILADKELVEMANKKSATKKSAKKSAAPAKSGARSSAEAIVTFKKSPKEGELPPQAIAIVALVEKAKELTVAKLLEKMEGVVKTKQTMQTIFSFYKSKLVGGGFLKVEAA